MLTGDAVPGLVYLGPKLALDEDLDALIAVQRQPRHGSQPDVSAMPSLFPHESGGDTALPALAVRRGGKGLQLAFARSSITAANDRVTIDLHDVHNAISATLMLRFAAGDALMSQVRLANEGAPLAVDTLAAVSLPLPAWATHATRFSGRWASEMAMTTAAITHGVNEAASREGRPGFGGAHWLLLHERDAGADQGRMLALHLASSGDGGWRVERDAEGVRVQMGSRFAPGEIVLEQGESILTPGVVVYTSGAGRNGIRAAAHAHVRCDVLPERKSWPVRRVHLNSWEALAFDLDEPRAMALAERAISVGAERFVLDDGWFAGRCNDRSSLGDWTPDPLRFPNGLAPLIAHVENLGMDFGLWVEPEMVSPDSALFRAHPDWALGPDWTQRYQRVLDLTQAGVADHLFGALDALLSQYQIAYLKWDHNRPLPIGARQAQAAAALALIDRLRAAHPSVEIESCASGGGRIDHATLRRVHRIWPSDNNDPIDRAPIDSVWSLFLPAEVRGSHVGPSPNPITGRRTSIDLRAKLAMFGHMGIEADPAAMTEAERARLIQVVGIFKTWRSVLHTGVERELVTGEGGFGRMIVACDGSCALALIARLTTPVDYNAPAVRLTGLEPAERYRMTLPEPWPWRGAGLENPNNWSTGYVVSGRMLGETGVVLPLQRPESAWLVQLERVRS